MTSEKGVNARYIYLYCKSVEQKKRYQELAKKAGMDLSPFLLYKIEDGLNPAPVVDSEILDEAKEEISRLRAEVAYYSAEAMEYVGLNNDLKELCNLYEKDRTENPTVEIKLLKFFKEHGRVTANQLRELNLTYNISDQLGRLELNGLIKSVGRGAYIWL